MQYRFSGHETFPCRYAWLPKAFQEIRQEETALADDEEAMIRLGVGKNMVRAIRFWLHAAGIAIPVAGGRFKATPFGCAVLDTRGMDPYLEDVRTLWLIHWQVSTHVEQPLFAWDYLLNRWPHPEFTRSTAMTAFKREAGLLGKELSDVTLQQHFDVFLHTYVPTRGKKGQVAEDNLDCPLVELNLIEKTAERPSDTEGHREAVYAFRRTEKPEITPELFIFCLADFWARRRINDQTLTLRDVALAEGSPGQILKLSEPDVRVRLEHITSDSNGIFEFHESTTMQQVVRSQPKNDKKRNLLECVYGREVTHV